jgi:hypothetical protein
MSELTIITNRKPRQLLPLTDLPEKAQADFDYLTDDDRHSYRFVQYKGVWYDVFDTQCIGRWDTPRLDGNMRVNADHPFAKWDSLHGNSFFSGVLFKFVGDGEVICGRYYS